MRTAGFFLRYSAGLWLGAGAAAAPSYARERQPVRAPLSAALFSPLDTNPAGVRVVNNLQLNLLYGSASALRGAAFGVGGNGAEAYAKGLQWSLGTNLVGGDMHGVQITGAYNRSGGQLDGLQLGLVNQAGVLDAGVQAGLVNLAAASSGMQWGLINLGDDLRGLQLATLNIADAVSGAQIGFVDLADGVNGTQIGFVNIADEVTGAQIGLVNVAEKNQFAQFGFVNIDSSNWFRLYVGVGPDGRAALGMRSGSSWFFGDVGFRSHPRESGSLTRRVSFVGGLGLTYHFAVFSLSGQFNRQVTAINDRPYTFPLTFTFPMGGRAEGFTSAGPAFSHGWTYREVEWLLGCQVLLRERRVSRPQALDSR